MKIPKYIIVRFVLSISLMLVGFFLTFYKQIVWGFVFALSGFITFYNISKLWKKMIDKENEK